MKTFSMSIIAALVALASTAPTPRNLPARGSSPNLSTSAIGDLCSHAPSLSNNQANVCTVASREHAGTPPYAEIYVLKGACQVAGYDANVADQMRKIDVDLPTPQISAVFGKEHGIGPQFTYVPPPNKMPWWSQGLGGRTETWTTYSVEKSNGMCWMDADGHRSCRTLFPC